MKDHLPQRKRTKKHPDEKPTQSKPTVPEKEKKAEKPSKEKPIAEKIEEFYGFTSRLLDRVIFPLIERLGKHLTVRISRFEVIIGSENAANIK